MIFRASVAIRSKYSKSGQHIAKEDFAATKIPQYALPQLKRRAALLGISCMRP